MSHAKIYFNEIINVMEQFPYNSLENLLNILLDLKQRNGRLFLIGSGGGYSIASHAVCDFRKLCGIEAYNPYDNITELTARVNDEGWENSIVSALHAMNLNEKDCIFAFSVGGGSEKENISTNIVKALKYAKSIRCKIIGIVSQLGGFVNEIGDEVVRISNNSKDLITPITESFQSILLHLIVSDKRLSNTVAKWESVIKNQKSN